MLTLLRGLSLSVLLLASASSQSGTQERHFTFHYAFTVRNTHPGEPLRVWIPLARSDEFQTVKMVSKKGDLPLRQTEENEYGNQLLYAAAAKADRDEYSFEVVYDVVRRQTSPSGARVLRAADRQRLLAPDRLVPTTGLP